MVAFWATTLNEFPLICSCTNLKQQTRLHPPEAEREHDILIIRHNQNMFRSVQIPRQIINVKVVSRNKKTSARFNINGKANSTAAQQSTSMLNYYYERDTVKLQLLCQLAAAWLHAPFFV